MLDLAGRCKPATSLSIIPGIGFGGMYRRDVCTQLQKINGYPGGCRNGPIYLLMVSRDKLVVVYGYILRNAADAPCTVV